MKLGNFGVPSWLVILGSIFAVCLFFLLCTTVWVVGVLNSENTLRNRLIQRNETVKVEYSNGYNILSNQNNLRKEENVWAKDVYLGVVEGRYKNDTGVLMKMVTEQNPGIDRTIATKFFNSLEIYFNQRSASFKDLAELKRQHDTMLTTVPRSLILKLFGRDKVDIVYVKDSQSTESFKTGVDDRQIVK